MQRNNWIPIVLSLTLGTFSPLLGSSRLNATSSTPADAAVHPLFDLSSPTRSPFPSDRFTVADRTQNTGRRVALPMPFDCVAHASECHDVTFLNQTRIIHAGAFEDRAAFYRHDRYWADNPTVPKNPHGFLSQLIPLIPAYVTIVRGAQAQVAEFSGRTV